MEWRKEAEGEEDPVADQVEVTLDTVAAVEEEVVVDPLVDQAVRVAVLRVQPDPLHADQVVDLARVVEGLVLVAVDPVADQVETTLDTAVAEEEEDPLVDQAVRVAVLRVQPDPLHADQVVGLARVVEGLVLVAVDPVADLVVVLRVDRHVVRPTEET